MLRRAVKAALGACLGLLILAASATADPVIAPDGSVYFSWGTPLTADAQAGGSQVYKRQGDVTTLMTKGGTMGGGNSIAGMSDDGSYLMVTSRDDLDPADDDGVEFDVYRVNTQTGQTDWVTADVPGVEPAHGFRISGDGSTVLVFTDAAIDPADVNGTTDIYRWSEGSALELMTPGSVYTPDIPPASHDASLVPFATPASLLPEDGDAQWDYYLTDQDGTLSLLTPGTPFRG